MQLEMLLDVHKENIDKLNTHSISYDYFLRYKLQIHDQSSHDAFDVFPHTYLNPNQIAQYDFDCIPHLVFDSHCQPLF